MPVELDGDTLTLGEFIAVTRNGEKVAISERGREKVIRSHEDLTSILESDRVAYGIKTGFGELCNVAIPREDAKQLQLNIVRSHSAAVGRPFPKDVVRGILLLRANALCKGCSGVRIEVVETLVEMLNRGVHPVIPSKGSVGSSGDLAPLAHMAQVMLGEGRAEYEGKTLDGGEAMSLAGIKPLVLEEKDGLALLNGTAPMTSLTAHAVADARNLLRHSLLAMCMSLDALQGSVKPFDPRIHRARPHPGQAKVAKAILEVMKGSGILEGHKDCSKVQDAYSLRCMPQVAGAVLDTLDFVERTVLVEMNSATDNPLIFGGESISGGNFHGEPVALSADYLGIAMTELANISERRTARLLDKRLSNLPAFLAENGGLNSGYMVAQYTAASLASENKVLSHPASADTIPTSANQEDHVSMGTTAARKLVEIVENATYVIAVEMLVAAQALDFHTLPSSPVLEEVRSRLRERVPHLGDDREVGKDIEEVVSLVKGRTLADLANLDGPGGRV